MYIMVFPIALLWLFAAAMVISSIGFKNYVWFISLGYGFSIAGEGALMLALYGQQLSLGTILCCALFIVYGCRLGGYLAIREFGSSSYKKNMKGEIKDGKTVPFGVKIAIWVTCALLYVTQVSAVTYRLENVCGDNVFVFIGAAVMLLGLTLESLADIQKNNAKKVNPRRFVDTGLYRLVRCPNYLGEMVFWTGVLISGIGAVSGWQWIIVAIGYVGIIFVMFSGARRLEIRQNKNYGNDPEYQKYVKTVPIMVPFIPLYSVEKYKWLVA
jgi:steroid 5-alpha reductase family enzyme